MEYLGGRSAVVDRGVDRYAPEPAADTARVKGGEDLALVAVEAQGDRAGRADEGLGIVDEEGAVSLVEAAPVPAAEGGGEGGLAGVGVVITVAAPAQAQLGDVDLQVALGLHGPPAVVAALVEGDGGGAGAEVAAQPQGAAQAARASRPREGGGVLVEGERQLISRAGQARGADRERGGLAGVGAPVVLGEDPLAGAAVEAVEGDVEGDVLARVALGAGVARRKDRADEGDGRQAIAPARAEPVEVPPGVSARRERQVAPRSCHKVFSAMRAERAAIGTPAPGCALPPTA